MSNVTVCCRFRPMNSRERVEEQKLALASAANQPARIRSRASSAHAALAPSAPSPLPSPLSFDEDEKQVTLDNKGQKVSFSFDRMFQPDSTQLEVYQHTAAPLIDAVMLGYNVTVFAYGQTGSGKTHTMMGPDVGMVDEGKGVIPRLVESLFDRIEQADQDISFTIKVSYVEIYNEQIKDLLDTSKNNLKIRESTRGMCLIAGATEAYVGNVEGVLEVMKQGTANRAVASTRMNDTSSRSHSVVIITVGHHDQKQNVRKGSKMYLVDLAGSEKIYKTGAEGSQLKEAQHINRSLSALGVVINKLTQVNQNNSTKHIPYRDSKLTRLLSDSLGGNSKTCLIITCSPSRWNLEESISTMRFGSRAKMIKNKPKANVERSVGDYKKILRSHKQKEFLQTALISELQDEVTALMDIAPQTGKALSFPRRRQSSVFLGSLNWKKLSNKELEKAVHSYKQLAKGGQLDEAKKGSLSTLRDRRSQAMAQMQKDASSVVVSLNEASDDDSDDSAEQELLAVIAGMKEQIATLEEEKMAAERTHMAMAEQYNFASKQLEHVADIKSINESNKLQIETLTAQLSLAEKSNTATQELHTREMEQLSRTNELLEAKLVQLIEKDDLKVLPAEDVDAATAEEDAAAAAAAAAEAEKQDNDSWKSRCESLTGKLEMLSLDFAEQTQNNTKMNALLANSNVDLMSKQKKVVDLEKKLAYAESMCRRLLESGMYWREKRRQETQGRRSALRRVQGGGKFRNQDTGIGQENNSTDAPSTPTKQVPAPQISPKRTSISGGRAQKPATLFSPQKHDTLDMFF